ncbi:unnamed protein product [Calypogeia fissa]
MTSALDMSLDDLIKNNKQVGGGRGGRGGKAAKRGGSNAAAAAATGGGYGGGAKTGGAARRQTNRSNARPNPYATAKSIRRAPDTTWQHDLFEAGTGGVVASGGRASGIETGTKLYISNLDYGVSNDDIKELFSEVGDLKRCSIHYDRSGRSKGTAEVVFSRKADGIAALKRYNNVQLDGKPMNIALVGTNLQTGGPAPQRAGNGALTAGRGRTVVMTPGFARAAVAASLERNPVSSAANRGRGNTGGRRGGSYRGRGRGRGAGRAPKATAVDKTAEDLDAELESYHSEAMQTS